MILSSEPLREFSRNLLTAAGVSAPNATLVATSLVAANLRGIDSHGVHLLAYYLKQLDAGQLNPHEEGVVASESGGCLTFDGRNGLGQVNANHCCGHAVRLARDHGIAIVTSRETNHFGACFWWARQIAQNGMIGMVFCNSSNLVAPWQGKQARFGTNPICMAVPPTSSGNEPWLLDMATTTVAANKIFKAHINHQPEIPLGWALDSDGVPTTSTEAAYHGLVAPLGGYKGYGLAMMAEILSAVLSGGAMGSELGGIRFTDRPVRVSHAFLAIDLSRFGSAADFTRRIEHYCQMMKDTPAAAGYEEILVPGEPEIRTEQKRRAEGIPIPDGNWHDLVEAAHRLNVPVPENG